MQVRNGERKKGERKGGREDKHIPR